MILRTADGTVYKVHFRHFFPTKPTRVLRHKGLCRGRAQWPIGVNFKGSGAEQVHYEDTGPSTVQGFYVAYSKLPMTQCLLHEGDCQTSMSDCKAYPYMGEARCSPRDTFTKKLGRQIALGRALKSLESDTAVREQLMADYERRLHGR